MIVAKRPAAYLHITRDCGPAVMAGQRYAISDATRRRGWPEAQLYLDDDRNGSPGEPGPALDMLTAAITAGRHDALLLADPGTILRSGPGRLMRLLLGCTRSGVSVECLTPPAAPRAPF